tara:strand:- start:1015 stop:2214 length:1200 start_codon:yes stop_codon:yes gene_type:complete
MNAIDYLLSINTQIIKLGLERTIRLNHACGQPDKNLSIIQIAGTNGKGSVCAIISKILQNANYKVGLYTSPHLFKLNERIRINGKPISDEDIDIFVKLYKKNIESIQSSFFETMTILALWYFNKHDVDYAIMETGLGGRLDSVSICNPIVTGMTSISLDHTEILGNSLTTIALEKCGIMKNDTPCFSAKQKPTVVKILQSQAMHNKVPLRFIDSNKIEQININLNGKKQKENAALAISIVKYIISDIKDELIHNSLKSILWHGRNQIIKKNPLVLFDVAHNTDGFNSFLQYYQSLKLKRKSILVIAIYERKNISSIYKKLEKNFEHIICTSTNGKKPMHVKILKNNFSSSHSVEIIKNPCLAINNALNRLEKNDCLAILGTHCLGPAVSQIFNISFDNI